VNVFGHAGDFDVADVGAVYEAGEVDEHDDGDEEEVELGEEFALFFGVYQGKSGANG
jgi:hypothetical protein